MTRTRATIIALATVYLSAMLLAPAAVAQNDPQDPTDRRLALGLDSSKSDSQKVIIPDGKTRLMPERENARIQLALEVIVPGPSECVGGQISVQYDIVKKPEFAIVTLSPRVQTQPYEGDSAGETPLPLASAPATVRGWATEAIVMFTRDAPAFEEQLIRIQAKAIGGTGTRDGCTAVDSDPFDVDTSLRADYLPSVAVLPDSMVATSGQNKKVLLPFTVHNLGNGPTRVSVTVENPGDGLETIQPPNELYLEPKSFGAGAQSEVRQAVTVLTNTDTGYTNSVYTFDALFRARSDTPGADLPTQEIRVPFSVKVQGVYVPGFDATGLLAALGMVVLGLGMARRRPPTA